MAAVVALVAGCSWIQPSNRVLAEQEKSVAADLSTTNSYQLLPCVRIGNKWYDYWPLAGGNNSAITNPVTI
ncbi:MAG: hypothetical protein WBH47_01395 [Streptosporangiaceae bacterium]